MSWINRNEGRNWDILGQHSAPYSPKKLGNKLDASIHFDVFFKTPSLAK